MNRQFDPDPTLIQSERDPFTPLRTAMDRALGRAVDNRPTYGEQNDYIAAEVNIGQALKTVDLAMGFVRDAKVMSIDHAVLTDAENMLADARSELVTAKRQVEELLNQGRSE